MFLSVISLTVLTTETMWSLLVSVETSSLAMSREWRGQMFHFSVSF